MVAARTNDLMTWTLPDKVVASTPIKKSCLPVVSKAYL